MNLAQGIDFNSLMEPVALRLLGEPAQKHGHEWRYGNRGSLSIDVAKGRWFDHEANIGGGVFDLIKRQGHEQPAAWLRSEGLLATPQPQPRIVKTYGYCDENGRLLFQVMRFEPKGFRERETITPWDAPPWREATAEYHRDRSGRLTVEIEPKRLERLRPLMAIDAARAQSLRMERAARSEVEVSLTGVFELSKAAGQILEGTAIRWDTSPGNVINAPAAGAYPIGVAVRGAATDDATCRVRLSGIPVVAGGA
jgi:hypothetical protein